MSADAGVASAVGGVVSGDERAPEVVLVRHAETAWSREGRHTGRADVPLTERGRELAAGLRERLASRSFALVLCSPLQRARDTCELAGLGAGMQLRDDLLEWDYGEYEGITTRQIRERRPGWVLWRDGCPGGEGVGDVGARADRIVDELAAAGGDVAVFSHGHLLRVLGARWVALAPSAGQSLALDAAGLALLGHEHEWRVLRAWNR